MKRNLIGSIVSFSGVAIVIIGDQFRFEVNLIGDLLTVGAVIAWIMYTHYLMELEKTNSRISKKKDSLRTLAVTKSLTFWGFILLIPASIIESFFTDISVTANAFDTQIVFSFLYLGIICSSFAYYFWNESIKNVGPRYTTNTLFTIPILTAIAQSIILKDIPPFTTIIGGILILAGLFYSENKKRKKA